MINISSKYVDTAATIQVIGCVFNNPNLLNYEDKYIITEEDFSEDFHRVVFGAIYKLYKLGAQEISLESINDFLKQRPKALAIFQAQKGEEWLLKISETCQSSAFDYYYNRLKKFSLLRAYEKYGVDVSNIYDPDNIFDTKKKQLQEDKLDNSTLTEIADLIDNRISEVRAMYVENDYGEAEQAGKGIKELIEKFKIAPEVGVPLYGPLINTVTRGARLQKFYLRSGASGYGKSRTMVADACYIGCDSIWDETFGWISTGPCQPTLFTTTEQEMSEVQTMMLAFLSGVNEEHILNGEYADGEEERVIHASDVLERATLYIEELPDFSLTDVENTIKRNIREHDVRYVVHDYIHTSIKILEEISSRSGGVKLREDNVLFMLSTRLKDICNKYGIFILSATQLSGEWRSSDTPDQNLLRGAKCALIYLIPIIIGGFNKSFIKANEEI